MGESPISQAGLASIGQTNVNGLGPHQEGGTRVMPRASRSIGRRVVSSNHFFYRSEDIKHNIFLFQPAAVATARIMGPIQISAGANPMVMSGEARMPFQNPMGVMPRMVCFTSFYFCSILLFRSLTVLHDHQCLCVHPHN